MEDGIARFLGVQEDPPPLCIRIPGHGIFAKCANVGHAQRCVAQYQDHCTRTELLVSGAASVVLAAPDVRSHAARIRLSDR